MHDRNMYETIPITDSENIMYRSLPYIKSPRRSLFNKTRVMDEIPFMCSVDDSPLSIPQFSVDVCLDSIANKNKIYTEKKEKNYYDEHEQRI